MIVAIARWILAIALPADVRDAAIAELDAEYAHLRSSGPSTASAWYCRQVLASLVPALGMRRRRCVRWTVDLLRDARFAARALRRAKAFTLATAATLALGIGSNTAVLSIVDGVLLRPLPYDDPASLVRVWSANPRGIPRNGMSPADYFDFRERVRGVASLAAFGGDSVTLTGAGDPVQLQAASATANLPATLGVSPVLGRWFLAEETNGDGQPVVVLGESLWRERFGGASDICGRTVTIDGRARTVVGVMPRSFQFPSRDERLWLPLPDASRAQSRSAHALGVVGRMAPATTVDAARESFRTIAAALEREHPDTNRGWGATVVPLTEATLGDVHTPLLLLLAAVSAVLLIACANVAGLLLARGVARTRELAVRAAIGASRAQLLRLQLVEALLLALTGGAVGLAFAAWGLRGLQAWPGLALPMLDRVTLDARVLAIAFALSCICAMLTGLLPAWRATRRDTIANINAGTRVTGDHVRTRHAIVFAQVAIATMLLAGGLLLLRSLERLIAVPAGFSADRTLLGDVTLPSSRYARDARAPFFDRVLDRIRTLPGVTAAGAGGPLPLSGQDGLLRFGMTIDGVPATPARSDRVYVRWATPAYFPAMGIALRLGREFTSADSATALPVAVIDEELASQAFGRENPIGRRIRLSMERTTWRTIVGVAARVRQTSLDRSADPHVYVPQAQFPSPSLTLVVRGNADAGAFAREIAAAIHDVDPDLPLANVRSLADLVAGSTARRRLATRLLAFFAAAALFLTLVGVYGVVSQAVAQSTREIGVRIALGAAAGTVLVLVLSRVMRVGAAGVVAGSIAAWMAAPLLHGMVFGIAPRDPVTLLASAALLLAATAAAAYVPARRILLVDVVNALRVD